MATKKGASKGAGKKSGAKKTASKKAGSKKAASKKTAAKKPAAGKCTGWQAWHDHMPPGPATLHVTGRCTFPTHGYKVTLKEAVPQGINPAILLLQKVVKPPTGPVIQTPEVVQVNFRKKTNFKYTHVTILPDGVTVKVKQVS
ncbi:MAG TPA: hypothetical protein VJ866_00660 [Pyrinomonadaceae bacterium]|nr:hypothetical protein [Pyrinomonadaceae bacterium]